MWYRYIFCKLRYDFVCHVTPQNHSLGMPCIFMDESSSQHVTTPKSLVTIGILIVSGKMLHQKRGSYKYVLPLKNWVDRTTTRQEKNVTTSKIYILARSAQKLKKNIFPLMTTSYNFALTIETSWAKKDVEPSLETWNLNDVIVYVWYKKEQF